MLSDQKIAVCEAEHLMECWQVKRQHQFQQLVRHYLSQILYGCKSIYCNTPSCLSSTRRNVRRPIRPPTQLTARALAHYLASQDDPQKGLCLHELKIPPNAIEVQGTEFQIVGKRLKNHQRRYVAYPAIQTLAHEYTKFKSNRGAGEEARLANAVQSRRQAKKDVKCLGQNLYDTASVIYNFSKQIPSPASVFDFLSSVDDVLEPHVRETDEVLWPQSVGIGRIPRQESFLRRKTRISHHSTQLESERLSNACSLHKIPYRLVEMSTNGTASHVTRPSSEPDTDVKAINAPRKIGSKGIDTTEHPSLDRVQERHLHSEVIKDGLHNPLPSYEKAKLLVHSTLTCAALDEFKRCMMKRGKFSLSSMDRMRRQDSRLRRQKRIIDRSLFYVLSNSDRLLKSFHDETGFFQNSPLPHLNSLRMMDSFKGWTFINGSLIFDSLWTALEVLYTRPPELHSDKEDVTQPLHTSQISSSLESGAELKTRLLTNHEAAHLVMVCIHALASSISIDDVNAQEQLGHVRSRGIIMADTNTACVDFNFLLSQLIDDLEYEPVLRLLDRLLHAIGFRMCIEQIQSSPLHKDRHNADPQQAPKQQVLMEIIVKHLRIVEEVGTNAPAVPLATKPRSSNFMSIFVEMLRAIILKNWNNSATIDKWSSVGVAVALLDNLHANLKLPDEMLHMPFFNGHLETIEEVSRFLEWSEQPNTLHIFHYPVLLPAQHPVAIFRTINFISMLSQYEDTKRTCRMQKLLEMFLREPHWWLIKSQMKVVLSDYLILDVSREDPLKDTLNQLWAQDKKMLLKPLKVKIGHQEGEVGLDHGGVTYEFFRIVLSEAFNPDNGMFSIDPRTNMTWFQPGALEPAWKYEMLGVLFSLAVYNGVTLPVTFPLALYHFLLPAESRLRARGLYLDPVNYIRDGWPDLAKSFSELLTWSDGDVGDVMMREYTFSYELYGTRVSRNIFQPNNTTSCDSIVNSDEPPMVTNANRLNYVRDYVRHLVGRSVARQIDAFKRGFLACFHRRSLHLFTAESLRGLVEGMHEISVSALRSCAKYEDGYSSTHQVIIDFWSLVEKFSQEDCRRLLEFVTASDRIPVTGYQSITFHIVRLSGETEHLPTSSTCFGKLYLPEYKDKEMLEKKLRIALQNSQGFGVV